MLFSKTIKLTLALFVFFTVATSFCDAEEKDPRDLVKKGVKFLGGEENLKKYQAYTFTEKGVFYGMGEGMEYTGKYASDGSSKFRMEIVGVFIHVFNGEKGWVQMAGQTTEMNEDQVVAIKGQLYAGRVMQLHPLTDKSFHLSFDGKAKVNGKNASIVKVSKKGQRDVRLFFDPSSGELVKSEFSGPMDGMPEKIVKYVTYLSDYKSDGKIKYAAKYRMTRDGEKFVEATVSSFKSSEKISGQTFVKPD